MTLIKSISGIRGTIGGKIGENLTPVDIVECTAAYAKFLLSNHATPKVVVGRDGRISGRSVQSYVINTLNSMGIDTIDLGLSTTPTVEYIVTDENAGGGIVITASHNPAEWNALKFLNDKGEFISADDGEEILNYIESGDIEFAHINALGTNTEKQNTIEKHVDAICSLDVIDPDKISSKRFHIAVDCINSTGAIAIPVLLDRLNCSYQLINSEVSGKFRHNPEPLPENLTELMATVKNEKADLGIAVDPDVDRLALVSENGSYFGEEYTLVACADAILSEEVGNTVSNLSSTKALRDITERYGGSYAAAKVGEVNVVEKMKEMDAVIGGEGNGGVILPALHYGRDALVGIALILNQLAKENISASELRKRYPDYTISKHKLQLTDEMDVDKILDDIAQQYASNEIDRQDGTKIYFEDSWIHMRKSNTEPIIRIYAESTSKEEADSLTKRFESELKNLI